MEVYIARLQNGFVTYCNCTSEAQSSVCKQAISKVIEYRTLLCSIITNPVFCYDEDLDLEYYTTFGITIRNFAQSVTCRSTRENIVCSNMVYQESGMFLPEPLSDDRRKFLVSEVVRGGSLKGIVVRNNHSSEIFGEIELTGGIASDFARWHRSYLNPIVAYSTGVKIDRFDNKVLNAAGFCVVFCGNVTSDETKTRIGRKLNGFNQPSKFEKFDDLVAYLEISEQIQDLKIKEIIYHEENRAL